MIAPKRDCLPVGISGWKNALRGRSGGVYPREIAHEKDLAGMKVIVTAGPTQESVDPVRYITNHSTGKMGYELAKAAMLRGAEVTLVSGVTNLEAPYVCGLCAGKERRGYV